MVRLRLVCALALGALAVLPACGSDPARWGPVRTDEAPREDTVPRGDGVPITGTDLLVPLPDPAIGSEVHQLTIPLAGDGDGATAWGVAFYRPGPMPGSVVGGVSLVYDDSAPIQGPDGKLAPAAVIAENANPGVAPQVSQLSGRTVIGWPASEEVPADHIPQKPRVASRYVILADHGIVMVTFDDVPAAASEAYLTDVAAAL